MLEDLVIIRPLIKNYRLRVFLDPVYNFKAAPISLRTMLNALVYIAQRECVVMRYLDVPHEAVEGRIFSEDNTPVVNLRLTLRECEHFFSTCHAQDPATRPFYTFDQWRQHPDRLYVESMPRTIDHSADYADVLARCERVGEKDALSLALGSTHSPRLPPRMRNGYFVKPPSQL